MSVQECYLRMYAMHEIFCGHMTEFGSSYSLVSQIWQAIAWIHSHQWVINYRHKSQNRYKYFHYLNISTNKLVWLNIDLLNTWLFMAKYNHSFNRMGGTHHHPAKVPLLKENIMRYNAMTWQRLVQTCISSAGYVPYPWLVNQCLYDITI